MCGYLIGQPWWTPRPLLEWGQAGSLYEIASAALIVGMPGSVLLRQSERDGGDFAILHGGDRPLVRLLAGVGFAHVTMLGYFVAIIISVSLSREHSRLASIMDSRVRYA